MRQGFGTMKTEKPSFSFNKHEYKVSQKMNLRELDKRKGGTPSSPCKPENRMLSKSQYAICLEKCTDYKI